MRLRSILCVLAALLGCGSESSPLTPNQFFLRRADATCGAIASACLVTPAVCTTARVAEYTAEYQNALANFRDFIPKNAEACLAKVKDVYGRIDQGTVALQAADYLAMETICDNVYRGSAMANGPCQIDIDCYGDLVCDKGYCGTRKLVAPGAGCANIGEYCPAGTFCSDAGGPWFCAARVEAQGSCASGPCLETLRCAGGICIARLSIAEACASNDDCGTGFCEPFASQCAEDVRFAKGSPACLAMGGG